MRRALVVAFFLASVVPGHGRTRIDLNGRWYFAIDPLRSGESFKWQILSASSSWAEVDVPHCWPTDPRYPYTGLAWYRRTFTVPPDAANQQVRIVFEGVFYHSKVWVNGRLVGEHEGGYTPFEFDITADIKPGAENILAVAVDNSWSTHTLPAARPGSRPTNQVYPWWDYGGIVHDAYLLITSPVYVANQRVVSAPDLSKGAAALEVTAWVVNAAHTAAEVQVGLEIRKERTRQVVDTWRTNSRLIVAVAVPPRSTKPVRLNTTLEGSAVDLWDQDHPNLYQLRAEVMKRSSAPMPPLEDWHQVTFGIRKLEIRNTELLLNGEPIRMGGANRHTDHPAFGLIDPRQVVDADMASMKTGNMEIARIPHYPASPAVLDWADRNGFLVIEEAGNWQLVPEQMESLRIRALFQAQTEEMVKRDWNRPSVIGWSVGNEYDSHLPAGVRWTRDMYAFVRGLDTSRFITFASNRAYLDEVKQPQDEGSHYVDLVSANVYGDPDSVAKKLDLIHARWPNKPIFISECGGWSALTVSEDKRRDGIHGLLSVLRKRPFVAGASLWTFSDYRSRFPDGRTDAEGYREFGVVDKERRPRPSYWSLREEFSPVVIRDVTTGRQEAGGRTLTTVVRILCRPDFPSYSLRDYEVRYRLLGADNKLLEQGSSKLAILRPGEERQIEFRCDLADHKGAASVKVEIVRPTGFVAADRTVTLSKMAVAGARSGGPEGR